jgi:hypothetical protein
VLFILRQNCLKKMKSKILIIVSLMQIPTLGIGANITEGMPDKASEISTSTKQSISPGGAYRFTDGLPSIVTALPNEIFKNGFECCVPSVRVHFPGGAVMMSATGQHSIIGSVGQTPVGPSDSASGHQVYWGFSTGAEQ